MTPPSWRLHHFATLPSTQDLCRARAEAGEPGRLAIRADVQTSGRGREGRAWSSPPGNLALSVLLRPGSPAAEAGQWALLAGVALAEALGEVLPAAVAARLKWPNDVLLEGGKLAGILAESSARADFTLGWVVIGFGVNLAAAPSVPGRGVACVADHAPAPDPARFAERLLARLDAWDARRAESGFAPVRDAWRAHGPEIGAAIAVRQGALQAEGAFAGLADTGALKLRQGADIRTFTSGEIEEMQPCCS